MGAGNLGLALADYPGFRQEGFEIVGALRHRCSEKVGQQSRGGVPIHDIQRSARRSRGATASASPSSPCRRQSAQHVVNLVVAAGIKAVLNFSPGTLQVPPDVKLKSVDLTVSLESLSFFLAQGETTMSRAEAQRHAAAALSHVDARGRVQMVDVGDKPVTAREAVARGSIAMSRDGAAR